MCVCVCVFVCVFVCVCVCVFVCNVKIMVYMQGDILSLRKTLLNDIQLNIYCRLSFNLEY